MLNNEFLFKELNLSLSLAIVIRFLFFESSFPGFFSILFPVFFPEDDFLPAVVAAGLFPAEDPGSAFLSASLTDH